jgi:hypothetical protein
MTLLDDLKALIAKYDAPVEPVPVEPAPVDTAPVDPAPADPVAAPAIIGGKVAVDGQDLLAKLASAVDGDTIGLADGGEFGALTISNSVSCTFSGQISGSGALNKQGLATFRVTGNSPGYTGAATVFDGTYKVDAQFLNSPVTVKVSSYLLVSRFEQVLEWRIGS